jgi:MATE family multidrug resistance protein
VIRAVDNISVLLALTILLNGIQPVLSGMSFELPQLLQACNAKRNDFLTLIFSGVAVGSGWQALVAYVNIGNYYLIDVPFGFLLGWGFHHGVQV